MARSVLTEIAELERLPIAELKERWRQLVGTEPPAYNRAHLVKRLAYRLQELRFGGLSESTRTRLREIAAKDPLAIAPEEAGSRPRRAAKAGRPVAGTRFHRWWHGEEHVVTALEDGFEYRGQRFRSLSAVARRITNARWSGTLFFGLRTRTRKTS